MAVDLVCGMTVNEKEVLNKTVYKGKTYYFCSAACRKDFEKNPAKYV